MDILDAILALAAEPEHIQRAVLKQLTARQKRELRERWRAWAHSGQFAPGGDWRVWLLMAGRGFGKTRAGAEWVSALARTNASLRIALVGDSHDEVTRVMIEGESGLLAVARPDESFRYAAMAGTLRFSSGAIAQVYSSHAPQKLRGPQHHIAWCDELAKWARPKETWENLMLGLRLGDRQQVVVTTTPQVGTLLSSILADPETVTTRGGTADNPHLSEFYLATMQRLYGGTRLGRQELEGELLEDVEGALWTRALIEAARCEPILPGTGRDWQLAMSPGHGFGSRGDPNLPIATRSGVVEGGWRGSRCPLHHAAHGPPPRSGEDFERIVVGVDPPAGIRANADACGIVVAGRGRDAEGEPIAFVLADRTVRRASPERWAAAVAEAAAEFGADRIVAEANNGGEMVRSVLKGARRTLPIRLVHASRGKAARAEPVAALFESGQAWFAGAFPALEDELCGIVAGGDYEGPGRSPDRADAMVWALTELMLDATRPPRIIGL